MIIDYMDIIRNLGIEYYTKQGLSEKQKKFCDKLNEWYSNDFRKNIINNNINKGDN